MQTLPQDAAILVCVPSRARSFHFSYCFLFRDRWGFFDLGGPRISDQIIPSASDCFLNSKLPAPDGSFRCSAFVLEAVFAILLAFLSAALRWFWRAFMLSSACCLRCLYSSSILLAFSSCCLYSSFSVSANAESAEVLSACALCSCCTERGVCLTGFSSFFFEEGGNESY